MSWDASGFDKPLILLEHECLVDASKKNAYKVTEELEPCATDNPTSDVYLKRLTDDEKFKEACDYLAYTIHHRAVVWWAYQCVAAVQMEIDSAVISNEEKEQEKREMKKMVSADKSAQQEAKQKSADMKQKFQDLEDQLKNNTFTDPNDPRTALQQQMMAFIKHPAFTQLFDEQDQMLNSLTAEQRQMVDMAYAQGEENYLLQHGQSFREAVRETFFSDLMESDKPKRESLMKREAAKLREQMDKVKGKISEKMAVFPLKIPGLPTKRSSEKIDDALEAAIRWVLAPTDVNAKLALDSGNVANGSSGMVAFAAFWSSNNLNPGGKQIVLSPPGLASKGIGTSLLAAMAKGGKKSFDQRYKQFYNIGVEVVQGINTWDDEIFKKIKVDDDDNNWEGQSGFGRK